MKNIQKLRFWPLNFLKRAYLRFFSGIAPSMKMMSTNLRVAHMYIYIHTHIYIHIGGLMGYMNIYTYIIHKKNY